MQSTLLKTNLESHSPFMYFGISHLKQCVGVSVGFAQFLDTTEHDLENIPLNYLVHKNDISKVNSGINDILNKTTTIKTFHFRLSFHQQRWYYVEAVIKKISNHDNVLGCYCTDISEQIRLHRYNSKVLRLMSAAGDVAHIGNWQLNLDPHSLYWSDEIYKIHGVTPFDYVPNLNSAFTFFEQTSIENIKQMINTCIIEKTAWSLKEKLTRPNGEIRYVILSGLAHTNEDTGEVDYIIGVMQDVTDIEIVQKERDLLACAAKSTIAGIIITDSERKVIWVNAGFERLTEYTLAEIKGQSLKQFIQGKNTDCKTKEAIKQALNDTKGISTEILNYTKNGREYWNKLIITPILQNSKLTNFVGVQHDITEQVFAKKALISSNAKLEEKVKARTLALNKAIDELKKQASTDPLTDALNRRALYHYFESIKYNKRLSDQNLWICALDIDHFKIINDKYGHACGDQVLIKLTELIHDHIRESDKLFRVGGEEFVIIIESNDKENAVSFIERLLIIIRETTFNHDTDSFYLTVSIGMHQLTLSESFDKSLITADNLLYEAKKNGRNRIELS